MNPLGKKLTRTLAGLAMVMAAVASLAAPAQAHHEVGLREADVPGASVDMYFQFFSRQMVEYDVYVRDTACDNSSAYGYIEVWYGNDTRKSWRYQNGKGCNTLREWLSEQHSNAANGIYAARTAACTFNYPSWKCSPDSSWYYNPHF